MSNNRKLFLLTAVLVILAALSRYLVPAEWFNFSPIGAIALVGAVYFRKIWMALVIPVAALFFSDLVINNSSMATWFDGGFTIAAKYQIFTFLSFVLIVLAGKRWFEGKVSAVKIFGGAVGAAVIFFLVTNAGSWMLMPELYPRSFGGLVSSFVAGIPFFRGTLAGNLVFSAILFGTMEFSLSRIPGLSVAK